MTEKGGVVDFSFSVTEQTRNNAESLLRNIEKILAYQVLADGSKIHFKLPQDPSNRGLSENHYSETFEIQVSIKIVQVIEKREGR